MLLNIFKSKKKLSSVFLSAKNNYSQKRSLKTRNVLIGFCLVLVIFVILGSVLEEKKEPQGNSFFSEKLSELKVKAKESEYETLDEYDDLEVPLVSAKKTKKQAVSQLLQPSNEGNFLGTKVLVELSGAVKASSNTSLPVEVRVLSNILSSDETLSQPSIEEGSKLLGTAKLNASLERLEITFHSLVGPFGKQKRVKAQAFMPDGSFGVRGEYSSGELKKYGSRMAGNFLGGLSQGLKQRSLTKVGTVLEIGNLKNAVLNGVSLSALDYARDKSRKNEVPQAFIKLHAGARFFVRFFNKESL